MPNSDSAEVRRQYADASNLNARINLHRQYSTNRQGWSAWVFEQLRLPVRGRVLEIGCGNGQLWADNGHRVPQDMALMLTDFSEGMLTEAKQKLVNVPGKFTFALADAESLPTGPNSVHAVIANHMLYHVPHLEVALTEIHRVLKPGGTLYCTTNGSKYMVEVGEILGQFDERIDYRHRFTLSFTLENGPELLSKYFEQVETRRYEDSLAVTNADDLIKCILSTGVASNAVELLKGNRIEEFRKLLEEGISAEGSIRISKPSGMLIARRAA